MLPELSSTDIKCSWIKKNVKNSEHGTATSVREMECYKKTYGDVDAIKLDQSQVEELKNNIFNYNCNLSAISKHK